MVEILILIKIEFKKPHFKLRVGDVFRNLLTHRDALVEWNVREEYTFSYIKNDNNRIATKCKKGYS